LRCAATRTATAIGGASTASISWSASTERLDDAADMDELRTADHLGCVGTTITLEVRAEIEGIAQAVFEAIARRAEPNCPVWKGLASEVDVKLIPILDEPATAEVTGDATPAAGTKQATPSAAAPTRAPGGRRGLGLGLRKLLGWSLG
jgi:hypothetical protein